MSPLRWLARRGLARFAGRYGYDVSYLETMLRVAPRAFYKFSFVSTAAAHRRAAPVGAYFAVKIHAAAAADCGPCTQLAVRMAREAGVDAGVVESVLAGRRDQLPEETALGLRFAGALAGDVPIQLERGRSAVRERLGEEALIELSLCWVLGQVFPRLKRALGAAEACGIVRVDDRPVRVALHAG